MLSDDQITFYKENGYVVVRDLLERDELEGMRRASDELVEKGRYETESGPIYDLDPNHRPDDIRVRRLMCPLFSDRRFYDISRSAKVLDIVGQLVGPEIRLSHPTGKLNLKQAMYGAPIEWHQDWQAYPHTNDDLLAVGIPLDDVDFENGPTLVIPGSHKGPIYSHHNEEGIWTAGIDPVKSGIDFSKAVPLTGKAGMMTLHHVRTVHAAAANTSDHSRRVLFLQYAALDAWPILGVPDFKYFNDGIVRGKPTLRPRMEKLPLLVPGMETSVVFEAQQGMNNSFFATAAGKTAG